MVSVSLPSSYRFLEVHAEGSHGVIIHAIGPDGLPCAIKSANPGRHYPPSLFRREMDIHSSLRVPGVVPVLDRWTSETGEAMALPWLPHRLSDRTPLKPDQALEILCKLAKTLESLHAQGVVHRDITPDNILFSSPVSPEPWLGDFGLAVKTGEPEIPAVRATPGFGLTNPVNALDPRQDFHGLAASIWSVIAGGGPPPVTRSRKDLMNQALLAGNPVTKRLARQFSKWLRRPPNASAMILEAEQLRKLAPSDRQPMPGFRKFFSWVSRYFGKSG